MESKDWQEEYLRERGVTREIEGERGYRNVLSGKPKDGAFAAAYGFRQKDAGLLIPLHHLIDRGSGELPQRYLLRLPPGLDGDGKFRTPAGQPNGLITHPRTMPMIADAEEIIIAEGVTRVDALAGLGVVAVGVSGCDSWRTQSSAVPDFEHLPIKGRRFVIAFDGDVEGNKRVADALKRLKRYLNGRGADRVGVLRLPDNQGLDDFIAERQPADREEFVGMVAPYITSDAPSPPPRSVTKEGASVETASFEKVIEVLGVDFRRNTRDNSLEVRGMTDAGVALLQTRGHDGSDWDVVGDDLHHHLHTEAIARFQSVEIEASGSLGIERWKRLCAAHVSHVDRRADPVAEWLDGLTWDGTDRLDRMFIDAMGASDTELNQATARAWLVGAVKRTFKAGGQHDWIPIFISGQGGGKSTFVFEMAPRARSAFASVPNINEDRKVIVEGIGPAALVEFDDINDGKYYARVKSFISTRNDRFREPYGLQSSDHPRHWVGAGTGNDDGEGVLPPDGTGSRRYVAIPVSTPGDSSDARAAHVRKYVGDNRDQLWAEAVHQYLAGASSYLVGRYESERDMINDQYTQAVLGESYQDEIEKLTDRYADTTQPIGIVALIRESGIDGGKSDLELSSDMKLTKAVAQQLKRLSWARKRTAGKAQWLPPARTQTQSVLEAEPPEPLDMGIPISNNQPPSSGGVKCDACGGKFPHFAALNQHKPECPARP